jgi:hypothetical protein
MVASRQLLLLLKKNKRTHKAKGDELNGLVV